MSANGLKLLRGEDSRACKLDKCGECWGEADVKGPLDPCSAENWG